MRGKLIVQLIIILLIISGCSKEAPSKKEPTATLPTINKVVIQEVDEHNIKVICTATGEKLQYAYYVYKDNKILQKISYRPNNRLAYKVQKPGEYMVKVYVRDSKGKKDVKNTKAIKVGI
jgi:hypothetical protein